MGILIDGSYNSWLRPPLRGNSGWLHRPPHVFKKKRVGLSDGNSPGLRPIGVLDLVFFWCWVLEVGMFTSPPPSQWALELRMLTLNGPRSTFEPSFCRFFGVTIFDLFFDTILHRFWLPKWSQNGAKIDQKSDFFVDWRWKRFLQVSSCF